ncbi:hypothetical protein JCM31598_25360 [Desulfonatronum parangueonense]
MLPSLQYTGTYTMVTNPNPQPSKALSQSSEAALILQEMTKVIMGIILTVADQTPRPVRKPDRSDDQQRTVVHRQGSDRQA